MPTLLKAFTRLRHSRGFGIHSPFAFRFVTEVLCQKLPYYGYAEIGRDTRLRLLYRLMAEFRPRRVAIYSSTPAPLEATVRRAAAKTVISRQEPDMVVADDLDTTPEQYLPHLTAGAHALILNASPQLRPRLAAALSAGMIFDNGHGTLVVASHQHLPRQDFDVKF
ncbi:MAG: hypothetical protein NC418_08370 [Muribaculaceae bacterium]|nr:hypothetical protein [Muribaculaceae bacterium]